MTSLEQALTVPGFTAHTRLLNAGRVLIYWTPVEPTVPPFEDPSSFQVPGAFAEAVLEPTSTGTRWHRLFVGQAAAGAGIFTACMKYAVTADGDTTIAAGSPLAAVVQQAGFDPDQDGVLRMNKTRVATWLQAHGS